MITEDKLMIYKRYNRDIDSWARNGSKKEKSIMADEDWYVIESLIQDIFSGGKRTSIFWLQ